MLRLLLVLLLQSNLNFQFFEQQKSNIYISLLKNNYMNFFIVDYIKYSIFIIIHLIFCIQKSHFKNQISYKNVLIGPTHMREMVK